MTLFVSVERLSSIKLNMFRFVTVAASLAAGTASASIASEMVSGLRGGSSTRQDIEFLFEEWRREFGMEFESAEEEHINRLNIFAANHVRIMEHNKSGSPYKMDHNQFSHLTPAEFSAQYLKGFSAEAVTPPSSLKGTKHAFDLDLSAPPPADIDWTTKGAVNDVENQGRCGSCWAFSTCGALEGRYFTKTGKLYALSEQQLVDCDEGDNGCNGGMMDVAFGYAEKNGMISLDAYPYLSMKLDKCVASYAKEGDVLLPVGAVTGYVDIPTGDENALKAAVAEGPVSVAIEADESAFQFYSSGVMNGDCGNQLDHGVLAVGYGTDGGSDYWKVKNSWGAEWGEEGYIRIERGTSKCGIADMASYPKF